MHKRIILSGCFLMSGILIYFLFSSVIDKNNIITSLIRNFIPDLLWSMSFYFFIINISKDTFKRYLLMNSIYVLFIGILFEIMQLFHIVRGTFDLFDILTYALGVLVANLIEIYMRRKEHEER